MAETDQERMVRILAASLTDRIEWALSLEARLAALEAGGGGGSGLPPGGDEGDVVTNIAPGVGDWESIPDPDLHNLGVVQLIGVPFDFEQGGTSATLAAGVEIYEPTPGDVLLALWVEIDIAWDGTTPRGDIGQLGGGTGLFHAFLDGDGGACLDMSVADTAQPLVGGDLLISPQGSDLATVLAVTRIPAQIGTDGGTGLVHLSGLASSGSRILPGRFTSSAPIKAVVSTDGTTSGGDPGSTQGSAALRMLIAGT